jgi:hypothetical protein
MRRIAATVLILMTVFAWGCDEQTCDQEKRDPCDQKASACINDKCYELEGGDEAFMDCFENLCQPALCACLDSIGCAWQDTYCDAFL